MRRKILAFAAATALIAPVWSASSAQAAPPPPPSGLSAVGLYQAIRVNWDDSTVYAGGYLAQAFVGSAVAGSCPAAAADDSCVISTGLTGGTTYQIQLSAMGAPGDDTVTVPVGAATPWTNPSTPASFAAQSGNGRIYFSWNASSGNGKSVTGYEVVSVDDSSAVFCTTTQTSCTTTTRGASALVNGTTYTAVVRARNGNSNVAQDASAWSAAVTATPTATAGLPSAPTGVTATAASTSSVSLTFTAGSAPSGFPISSYSALCTSGNGGVTGSGTATAPATTVTVPSLTSGATYTCAVSAININGSAASTASNAVTLGTTTPGAPTGVTATGGDAQATVNWTAPSPAPTGGYEIQYRLNLLGSDWLPATPLTASTTTRVVTGLTNGLQYFFRVRSTNGASLNSGWAETATAVTPGTNPAAPISLTAVPGNGQAAMSWSILPGSAPTGYAVQYSVDNINWLPATTGQLTNSTAQTYTLTGLTNGTAYYLRVRALNGVLTSAWTQMTGTITPVGLPGVPTSVVGLSGNGQVELAWVAPTSTAANPVTGYKIQYSINGGTTWTAGPVLTTTATTAIVPGLTNGQSYVFRVIATNGSGDGTPSAASAAIVPGAPAAPTSLTAQAGNRSAVLTWTILIGAAPTGYEVQYSTDAVTWAPTPPLGTGSTALTYTLTGLTNGTPYYLRVRALNGAAASAWTQMTGTVTPIQPRTIEIIDYERNRQGAAVVSAEATGFAVGSTVNFRIRVYSKGKWSAWRLHSEVTVGRGGLLVGTVDNTKPIKARFVKDGVNSEIVTIPKA